MDFLTDAFQNNAKVQDHQTRDDAFLVFEQINHAFLSKTQRKNRAFLSASDMGNYHQIEKKKRESLNKHNSAYQRELIKMIRNEQEKETKEILRKSVFKSETEY